jgi:2-oxoglutarate ferredoxin oxidoreductase subunit beta
MKNTVLSGEKMPFCPGCGHGPSVKYLSNALVECGLGPLDIILVSDIGCSGLVDPLFATHTIHGLHGRSPALATGIALANEHGDKKIITVQGDGGATIGLQHILEASRRNIDITLILLNNLIYGMTGGQVSGLSTTAFKHDKSVPDETDPFDVCALANAAGASFVSRVNNPKEITSTLVSAINTKGFSLVEVASMCQAYGAKKLEDLIAWSRPEVKFENDSRTPTIEAISKPSLLKKSEIIIPRYPNQLNKQKGILIAGSAGGGVQAAAKILARAGMLSGLNASMKGEYPITVGTGFSLAEVILANGEINYTGLEHPDVMLIVTSDGLKKVESRINKDTKLYLDNRINIKSAKKASYEDFLGLGGAKGAALAAITFWLNDSGIITMDSLYAAASSHKHSDSLEVIIGKVLGALSN